MTTELDSRMVELETRLAFQEHTLQALNDIVTRQQQQIEALIREAQTLKDRLRAAAPSPVGPPKNNTENASRSGSDSSAAR